MAYCEHFPESDYLQCKKIFQDFVNVVGVHFPEFTKKVKIHLLLHLADCMMDFDPTCAFNTERFVDHFYDTCCNKYHAFKGVRHLTL